MMRQHTILLVEDEAAIREMVEMTLAEHGYHVVGVPDSASALEKIYQSMPDLVLLDWMLPDLSGLDLARRLKQNADTREIPIIMLTARVEETDKVRGLEAGADDYVTKPFSPRELAARIKAVLRRAAPLTEQSLYAGGMELNPETHRVTIDGCTLEIGPTEFRLLQFFMSHPERVYTRDQLISRVWGATAYIDERTVDVHIRRLRRLLTPHGYQHMVQTVRGTGYRFSPGSQKPS